MSFKIVSQFEFNSALVKTKVMTRYTPDSAKGLQDT